MSFASNPPLDEHAGPLHLDLLALVAGLVHGPPLYFYDVRTLAEGLHARTPFLGGTHAANYLREARITEDLVRAVRINPLVDRLKVDTKRLEQLVGERPFYAVRFEREGSLVEPGTPVCRLSGNSFCTSLVWELASRIWLYQTATALTARAESEEQRQLLPDRYAGALVPLSIVRAHSPTIAAYAAHAYVRAGYERRTARGREELATATNAARGPDPSWAVRARAMRDRLDRRALILKTGRYSPAEADALLAGRLIGITEEEYVADDLHGLLFEGLAKQKRAYYSERGYVYADPLLYAVPEAANGVLLTDTCYGTTFAPPAADDPPLYGRDGEPTQGLGGASIEGSLASFRVAGFGRAGPFRIPFVEVDSVRELAALVSAVERTAHGPLLFRGQPRHFSVNRPAAANRLLYGTPGVDELSLTTAASRAGFEWDHFQLRFELQAQGLLYADLGADRFAGRFVDPAGTLRFEDAEIQRRDGWWQQRFIAFEQACMGIAQHYGIPTDGLDLTSDLTVAVWFATSVVHPSASEDGEAVACYRLADPQARPVVYVVSADLSEDAATPLDLLGGLRSSRAERQRAHLHYGGWGLHTNLCATETLVGVYLSRACAAEAARNRLPAEALFPGEAEDPLFAQLLDLRRKSREIARSWGFDRVVRYAHPDGSS